MKATLALAIVGLAAGCYDVNELVEDYAPDLGARDLSATVDGATSGTVSLLAGQLGGAGAIDGIGSAARFNKPTSIAYDGQGSLYIADSANDVIRKLTIATGAVNVFVGSFLDAGSTNVLIDNPLVVTADGGNVFVADNGRIFEISDGQFTTIATDINALGLVVQNGRLYFSVPAPFPNPDGNTPAPHISYRELATDGSVGDPVTFANVGLNFPTSMVSYGAGGLLVVDAQSASSALSTPVLRVVDASGNVSSGNGTSMPSSIAFSQVGATTSPEFGLAKDSQGNVYVGDGPTADIQEFEFQTSTSPLPLAGTTAAGQPLVTGSTDGPASIAVFSVPSAVAHDVDDGTLYIADRGSNTIRAFDLLTNQVSTIAGTPSHYGLRDGAAGTRFNAPEGLAYSSATKLVYVADTQNHVIRTVDVRGQTATIVMTTQGDAGAPPSLYPTSTAVDGQTNIYFTDSVNNAVYRVAPDGATSLLAGSPTGAVGSANGKGTAASFSSPYGIALDSKRAVLYVADEGNAALRIIALDGTVTTRSTGVTGVYGLAYDPIQDELYMSSCSASTIQKLSFQTNTTTLVAGVPNILGHFDAPSKDATFFLPHEIALDGAGSLYVADFGNSTIRKVDLVHAQVTTLAGVAGRGAVVAGPLPAQLNSPYGLVWVPDFGLVTSIPNENSILSISTE